LNLEKCFWFLLAWDWHQGKAKLSTLKSSTYMLKMTSEMSPVMTEVKRIEPASSYCTLRVYISPSGKSAGPLSILCKTALEYCSKLVASTLTRKETLTSYIQYILPKLRYQPPLLQLTTQECDKLMSPILMAILLKMHLNRNTSRAIIHGAEEMGGLAIPHLYTIQGINKIKLFVSHLRLQDRTAKLIHIDLSYIQLLTGTGDFFLNKDYEKFSWMETGWISSLWEFSSKINLTFSYPSAWQPPLPRQEDIFLTDFFIRQNLPHKELDVLNRCCLYLQVVTLSDIAAANGQYILPGARNGVRDNARVSRLSWPEQGKPTAGEWSQWKSALSSLELYGRLKVPLEKWISSPHQQWVHFMDEQSGTVYEVRDTTRRFLPILHNVRTRSGHQCWIDTATGQSTLLIPEVLLPATITHQTQTTRTLASVIHSTSALPTTPPTQTSMDSIQTWIVSRTMSSTRNIYRV
jgi:hypothetical protein